MSSRQLRALGFVAALAAPGLQLPAAPVDPSADPPPLAFKLKDQFDIEYTEAMSAGKIALVIVADREGSQFSGKWSQAIGRGLNPETRSAVVWVPVATLSGIPGFVHGFVTRRFPQDKASWTLMDWSAHFSTSYALPAKCCNVLVFGPDGRLAHRAGGREVDPAAVAAIVACVASLAVSEADTTATP